MTNFNFLIYALVGLASITLVDTIGAIASRKMNFKYSYLSVVSFTIYILVAFFVAKDYSLPLALFINAILGLYDGTKGFWFSIILKANNGLTTEQINELLGVKSGFYMILISLIFSIIGYILTYI